MSGAFMTWACHRFYWNSRIEDAGTRRLLPSWTSGWTHRLFKTLFADSAKNRAPGATGPRHHIPNGIAFIQRPTADRVFQCAQIGPDRALSCLSRNTAGRHSAQT
jgi:hypothetical protein